MAAAFMIETESVQLRITGPHLKRPVMLECETVDGAVMAIFRKSDDRLQRLLTSGIAPNVGYRDLIYQTDILERLEDLKNAKWDELFPKLPAGKARRYTSKKGRAIKLAMPEMCEIMAPTIGNVAGVAMKVRLTQPNGQLSIEMTAETLQYLRSVMAAQIGDGGSPSKRACVRRSGDLPPGVAFATWKSEYDFIATHTSINDDGDRVRTRFYTSSLAVAVAFTETGKRPRPDSDPVEIEIIESVGEIAKSGDEAASAEP